MFDQDIVEIDDEHNPHLLDEQELPDAENVADEDEGASTVPVKELEDQEAYSKKVQKRIDKLIYERNVEREQREALEQRLAQVESRFQKEDQDKEATQAQSRMEALRSQKADLLEIGDYAKAAEVDEEIIDLKLKQRESGKPEQRNQPTQRQSQTAQTATQLPEAQLAWLDNNDWYHNPRKAAQAAKANETYLALINEGYDPEDEQTYKELDKRINTVRQEAAPTPGRPDRGSLTGSSKQVQFTNEDAAKMRNWGLDPNDVKQRKEYLSNKRAAA